MMHDDGNDHSIHMNDKLFFLELSTRSSAILPICHLQCLPTSGQKDASLTIPDVGPDIFIMRLWCGPSQSEQKYPSMMKFQHIPTTFNQLNDCHWDTGKIGLVEGAVRSSLSMGRFKSCHDCMRWPAAFEQRLG